MKSDGNSGHRSHDQGFITSWLTIVAVLTSILVWGVSVSLSTTISLALPASVPQDPSTPDTVKQLRDEAAKDRAQAARKEREARDYRELAQEQRREAARRRDPSDKRTALEIAERREREAKELEDEAERLRDSAKLKEARADALEAILRMSPSPAGGTTSTNSATTTPTTTPIQSNPGSSMPAPNSNTSPPARSSVNAASAKGMIRMVTPKKLVPGEAFEVVVNVPAALPNLPKDGFLRWGFASDAGWEEKEKERLFITADVPGDVGVVSAFTAGSARARMVAPYNRKLAPTGQDRHFEIRLYQGWDTANKMLDVLDVTVRIDKIPNLLQLTKTTFKPGESIEFTVTLPENRYYYGHHSGPTVLLYPIEWRGRRLSDKEARDWAEPCSIFPSTKQSCVLRLITLVQGRGAANSLDGGFEIKPGTYSITTDVAKKLNGPLLAPAQPGRYELRLYDRGYAFDFQDYVDQYFASQDITVEYPEVTEIIKVPVDGTVVTTKTTLKRGVEYSIQVSGTAIVGGPAGGIGDAEYFGFSRSGGPLNSCALSPTKNLDVGLAIDDVGYGENKSPNWGRYNPVHLYKTTVIGSGVSIKFKYRDCDYRDNQGSLTVQIRELPSDPR